MYKLYPKCVALILVLLLSSCYEDCLNLEVIDSRTQEINTWFTDSNIETKTVTSSVGIDDEVLLQHDFRDFGDSIWDDCGGVSQSFSNTTNYQFFNFPFQLSTELYKQGEENEFWFYLNTSQGLLRYNFSKQTSSPRNSMEEIFNFQYNNQNYPTVLKVDFPASTEPTHIKSLYFAKGEGVLQLTLNNGIVVDFFVE